MKNFKKLKFCLLAVSLFVISLFVNNANAQTARIKVTGTVKAAAGDVLSGVTVKELNTNNGVQSDANGKFTIFVPKNALLSFSYVGYKQAALPINGKQTVDITLEEESKELEQVIVIGYGSVKKKDLTGSVSSVKAEEIVQTSPVSIEQAIQGRAAGVQVTSREGSADGGLDIRIRGASSINASTAPLYVVDGFPIQGDNNDASVGLGNSTSSPLRGINPSDIESIEILKDASATAIYGSRGNNGVVIITTKSGKKGVPKVTLDMNFGKSYISKEMDVLKGDEYINFYNTVTAPPTPTYVGDIGWQSYRDTVAPYNTLPASQLKTHNWQDEAFRNTFVSDNKLTVSGGTDYTKYYAGMGVTRSNGILLNSDFSRYSLNFKIDQKVGNKVRTGLNMTTSFIDKSGLVSSTNGSKSFSGVVNQVLLFRPVEPKYLYDGADVDANGELLSERSGELTNPIIRAENEIQTQKGYQTFANTFLEYEPIKNLKFLTRVGVTYDANKGRAWYPAEFGWGKFKGGGIAIQNHTQSTSWLNENTVSYQTTIGKGHRINALAGFTAQKNFYERFQLEGEGFQIPGVNIDNISSATVRDPNLNNSDAFKTSIQSVLGRLNYSYKGKYLITGSIRTDGSSKFGDGHKWGTFPSGAVAWNVDEENFMKNALPAVSTFKLRASYGLTGNTGIPPFQSQSTLIPTAYQLGNNLLTGLAGSRLPNSLLTWEKTKQFDFGVELGFLNNRFNLAVDYYNKNTYDLLLQKPISYASGFDNIFSNIGAMINKGLEISLNTTNIKNKNFTWNSNFNISFNKNTVGGLGLDGTDRFFVSGLPYDGSYSGYLFDYIVQTGQPVGSIYGWTWDGVYQYKDFTDFNGMDAAQSAALYAAKVAAGTPFTLQNGVAPYKGNVPRPGYMKFADISGPGGKPDGVVDDLDKSIIGNPTPKHFGGFTNNFQYKNFSLDVLMTWSYGNDIYNKNMVDGLSANVNFRNQLGQLRDAWTPLKESNTMYAIRGRADAAGDRVSTFLLEDGSYLRMQNVTLSYAVNNKTFQKVKFVNAKFFVSMNNLHVWTKYSGFDPEVSVGNNALTRGIDFASYPRSKNIRIGFSTTF